MPATREMLEGEAYWGRIRGIKRNLYIVEMVLVIIAGLVLVITSGEFSADPFMLPFDKLLWFIAIMLFVIEIQHFVFRTMQLNIARSDSIKYIMATNSIRRGVVVAIVSVIIAALLLFPGAAHNIETSISYKGTVTPGEFEIFQNRDFLGLTTINTITVHCSGPSNVYLISQFIYDQYPADQRMDHPLNSETFANPDLTIDLRSMGSKITTYYIFTQGVGTATNNTKVDYTLDTTISGTVTSFIPIIAMLFVVANSVWITYLYPLRRKCACKSIYK